MGVLRDLLFGPLSAVVSPSADVGLHGRIDAMIVRASLTSLATIQQHVTTIASKGRSTKLQQDHPFILQGILLKQQAHDMLACLCKLLTCGTCVALSLDQSICRLSRVMGLSCMHRQSTCDVSTVAEAER